MTGTLLLFLLLWVAAGAIVFAWGTWTPRPGSRRLVRTAGARVARVGDEVAVRLWPAAPGVPARRAALEPRRVVLVLDHSSSMGEGPGSPLEHARVAAASFARSVAAPRCPVGVVAFADGAETAHPLAGDPRPLRAAILAIGAGGGTDIAAGLRQARSVLGHEGGPRAGDVVVLLSDGGSDPAAARAAASRLHEAGVRVVALGVGTAVNHELLREIASSPDDVLHVLRPEGLGRLYDAVAAGIPGDGGFRADLREQADAGSVLLSSTGEFLPYEVSLGEGTLRWFIPFVPRAGGMEVGYAVRPLRCGWYPLARGAARIEMRDGEGAPHAGESNRSPHLLVLPRAGWPFSGLLLNPLWWMLAGRLRLWRGRRAAFTLQRPPEAPPLPLPQVAPLEAEPRVRRPGDLHPALVVGAGHAGGLVIRALRHHLAQLSPPAEGEPRWLHLDTGAYPVTALHDESLGPPLDPGTQVALDANLHPLFQSMDGGDGNAPGRETLRPADFDLSTGTHGRRVLGGAALEHHLAAPGAALPARIDAELAAVGPRRRVLVVASTSGGTGGGMLPGLLRLLRERIDASPHHARLDVLLLSHRAVEDTVSPEPGRVLNSAALLSELGRMAYRDRSGAAARRAVDRVLLLEAPVEGGTAAGGLTHAAHAAAEVLLHLLAAPGEGLDAWIEGRTPGDRRLQRECGQTLLYGVGASLRFVPAERARAAVAREAAAERVRELAGMAGAGAAPAPAVDGAAEGLPFLLGALPPSGAEPAATGLLSAVAAYPGTGGAEGGIPFALGGQAVSAQVLALQQQEFERWLAGWAHRALAGGEGGAGESPGPGLAQLGQAVETLHARVSAAAAALRGGTLPAGWGEPDRVRAAFVADLFSRYAQSLHRFRRHLEGWGAVLAGTGSTPGALPQLAADAAREREAMERELRELRPFACWPAALDEAWRRRAAEARASGPARWGAWGVRAGADGEPPELVLALPGGPPLALSAARAEPPALAARIEAAAREALPPLLPLHEAMDTAGWLAAGPRADPVEVVQERQGRWTAVHAQPHAFALVGGRAADLSAGAPPPAPRIDPHRVSVVRALAPCVLPATGTWTDAEVRLGDAPLSTLPLLDAVERRAAACADLFPWHGLTRPLFSPAVRTYFAAPERLRDLLLAAALGRVRPRLLRRAPALFLGDQPLTGEREEGASLLLEALDRYVLSPGDVGPAADGLRDEVERAVAEMDGATARGFPAAAEAGVLELAGGAPPAVAAQLAALARFYAAAATAASPPLSPASGTR